MKNNQFNYYFKTNHHQAKNSWLESINWLKITADYQENSSCLAEKQTVYKATAKLTGFPLIPQDLTLRDYQKEAVINWFKNKGRGTLKMATGSGKTITALAIVDELYNKINLEILLVICPFRHLVIQWAKEAEKFNLRPILAFENVHTWQNDLSHQLYQVQIKKQKFLTIITTNATFISDGFQSQLSFFSEKTLLIGDEAHNLGSPKLQACLPHTIGLRLALSATPERHYDEDGTEALINYFGKVLKPEFTLANAIQAKALVSYNYHPILVELTASEAQIYGKLTTKICWELAKDNGGNNPQLNRLLFARSRLVGNASNKLGALKDLMKNRLETHATLFYCGDGYSYYEGEREKQVTLVTRILGRELNYRVNIYTAETPLAERELITQQLQRGDLQGIVAIRCLDEGVDIPMIENAVILASSGNPRQFIQRRGRILRPYEGKEMATLFDMIVIPPELDREVWVVERNLLKKELKRFIEFANLADNRRGALDKLLQLQSHFQLD